jgi:formylglycine-generating enzyme required for sulfatase activity
LGNEFAGIRCNLVDSQSLQPVGSFPGGVSWLEALDMAGNMMEWVQDWLEPYTGEAMTDPSGPASGKVKVEKGGCLGGNMLVGAQRTVTSKTCRNMVIFTSGSASFLHKKNLSGWTRAGGGIES